MAYFTLLPLLLLIASFLVLNARGFFGNVLSGIGKMTLVILALLFLFNIYLNLMFPDVIWSTNIEFYYWDYARSLSEFSFGNNIFMIPFGYVILVSLVFSVFGASLGHVYILNLLFGALSVIAIFFVSYFLTRREDIGLYSASFMSAFPLNTFLSNTLGIYSPAVFFSLLSLGSFLFYLRVRTYESKILALMLLAFTVYIRLELLVLILPIGMLLLLFDKGIKFEWRDNILLLALFAMLILPQIIFLHVVTFSDKSNYYEGGQSILSLERIPDNIASSRILTGYFYQLLPIFFLGNIFLVLNRRRELAIIYLWVVVFFLVYLSFWAYCERFDIMIYVMIMLIWSSGLGFISDIASRASVWLRKNRWPVVILIVFFAAFSFPLMNNTGLSLPTDKHYYIMERDAVYHLDSTLNNCTLAAVHPQMFTGKNIRAFDAKYLESNQDVIKDYEEGCLLFVEDIFCKIPGEIDIAYMADRNFSGQCNLVKGMFNLTPYKVFNVTRRTDVLYFSPLFVYKPGTDHEKITETFVLYNISLKG